MTPAVGDRQRGRGASRLVESACESLRTAAAIFRRDFGASGGVRRFRGFGSTVTLLALQTLVVVTLRGGPIEVGWLNAARWLPYLVFGLVVGALVDRIGAGPLW